MVLTSLRRICSADAAADRILASADALVSVDGRLVAVRPADDRRLQTAVDVLIGRTPCSEERSCIGLPIARRSGGTDYVLLLCRAEVASGAARRAGSESEPLIVAVIHAYEARPPIPIDLLQDSFGLTAAEARLAACFAGGCSPKQAASDLCVSLSTVRTHLRAIYRKTGTSGQVDLAWRIAAVWSAATVAAAAAAPLERAAVAASFDWTRRPSSQQATQSTMPRALPPALTQ